MAITANGQQQPKRWTSRSESENAAFGFMGVTSCSFLCGGAGGGERGVGLRRVGGLRRGPGRREAQGAEVKGVG